MHLCENSFWHILVKEEAEKNILGIFKEKFTFKLEFTGIFLKKKVSILRIFLCKLPFKVMTFMLCASEKLIIG